MITTETLDKPDWFATTFRLNGSVVVMVLPRILLFCALTAAVSLLYTQELPIYLQKFGDLTTNVIYNLVLGLLLVFRTNTSYERFWEGRKAWGAIVVNVRNLAQAIQIGITTPDEQRVSEQKAAIQLLSAFAVATKLHLRGENVNSDLKALMTSDQAQQLETSKNRPLQIAFWIRSYLQHQLTAGYTTDTQVAAANEMINSLIEGISTCERILTTPIPIAYRIYLKRLILIYCLGLPFRLVPTMTWWALPVVAIVSFLLLGVEEVGRELENPFGYEPNDLPLDEICSTILSNVEMTTALEV